MNAKLTGLSFGCRSQKIDKKKGSIPGFNRSINKIGLLPGQNYLGNLTDMGKVYAISSLDAASKVVDL